MFVCKKTYWRGSSAGTPVIGGWSRSDDKTECTNTEAREVQKWERAGGTDDHEGLESHDGEMEKVFEGGYGKQRTALEHIPL